MNLDDGMHAHFVREASSYDVYSITVDVSNLENSVDLVNVVTEYAYADEHDMDNVKFCISEDARMRADDGNLQSQASKSFSVFELSDGTIVYTDLPVYVCNDAGKTIDSYNTG